MLIIFLARITHFSGSYQISTIYTRIDRVDYKYHLLSGASCFISASTWKSSSNVPRQVWPCVQMPIAFSKLKQRTTSFIATALRAKGGFNPTTILHSIHLKKHVWSPPMNFLIAMLDVPVVHYGEFWSCMSSFFSMKLMTFQSKPRYWSHRTILDFLVSLGTFWPLNHCFETWV